MKEQTQYFGLPKDIKIVLKCTIDNIDTLESKIKKIENFTLQVKEKIVEFENYNIPEWFFKYKNWEYRIINHNFYKDIKFIDKVLRNEN